ncbi:MAG: cysteine rich repeat-containing protein [Porticoccus sp.]
MKMIRAISFFILTSVLFFNPAMAEEGQGLMEKLSKGAVTITADLKGCDEDSAKYCPGLDPKSKKAFMCMMAYEESLSDSCKLGIVEAAMAIKQGVAAIEYSVMSCEADADKFCLDVQPGEGAIVNCLKANEAEVSPACTTALKETGIWNAPIGGSK